MRVVIADDEVLLRDGLSRLLDELGVQVLETVGDAPRLLSAVARHAPDVAIVDIKMPPTRTDEGLVAAMAIRERYAATGVLVLSHYLDASYATRLIEHNPSAVGYLLKERVSDVVVLVDALRRIVDGECVVDPTIVSRLFSRRRARSPLDELTEREREVLALMAEGCSNGEISRRLALSTKTVERHIGHIFDRLGLQESATSHRRVLAVLTLLRGR